MAYVHPRNPWISNGRLVEWYLWSLRRRVKIISKLIGTILNTDIDCPS